MSRLNASKVLKMMYENEGDDGMGECSDPEEEIEDEVEDFENDEIEGDDIECGARDVNMNHQNAQESVVDDSGATFIVLQPQNKRMRPNEASEISAPDSNIVYRSRNSDMLWNAKPGFVDQNPFINFMPKVASALDDCETITDYFFRIIDSEIVERIIKYTNT